MALGVIACSGGKRTAEVTATPYQKVSPDFNADSAYHFVDKQVAFGPRIPNSEAHKLCGNYLMEELKRFGAQVIEQKADLKAYDGTILHARNIIGSYRPEQPNRILLFSHWDSRPVADHDPDESLHKTPILGANDGASGVGVLLEIARNIQLLKPNWGIDIIFFDAEDYGTPDFVTNVPDGDWWCLGSQYWSKNPHISGYKARYGILLDMVGGRDATFYKEYFSKQSASGIVEKIWNTSRSLGYGRYFVDKNGGAITDDHVPIIDNLHIPCVDIIQHDPNTPSNFGWYWHTTKDDMNSIDKNTLKAVGQTLLEVIYKEK
jgi:Zn-dependent M28 family amino/carboxypeptidase